MVGKMDWLMPIIEQEICPECMPLFGFHDSDRLVPPVDIYEDDKNLFLKMELTEVMLDDVNVEFDSGVLTVSGKRETVEEGEKLKYHRRERISGEFKRSFRLPEWVDTQNVVAESEDGVLRITIPKKKEQKPKKIEIEVK